MPGPSSAGSVESLWRFPVKSMQGEQLESASITEAGLVGDRAYGVIDVESGKVASTEKHPRKWAALLGIAARSTSKRPSPARLRRWSRSACPTGARCAATSADADPRLSSTLGRAVRLSASAPGDRTLEAVWPDVPGMAPEGFITNTRIGTEADGTVTDVAMGSPAPAGTSSISPSCIS